MNIEKDEKKIIETYKKAKKAHEKEKEDDKLRNTMSVIPWILIVMGVYIFFSTLDGRGHIFCASSCEWGTGLYNEGGKCVWPIPTGTLIWRLIYSPILVVAGWKWRKFHKKHGILVGDKKQNPQQKNRPK